MRNGGKPSWYRDTPPISPDSARAIAARAAPPPKPKVTIPIPPPEIPAAYGYNPAAEHYCIVVLPGIDSRTAGLKKAIKDLNAEKYPTTNLDLLFDLYNRDQGVIVIKKF